MTFVEFSDDPNVISSLEIGGILLDGSGTESGWLGGGPRDGLSLSVSGEGFEMHQSNPYSCGTISSRVQGGFIAIECGGANNPNDLLLLLVRTSSGAQERYFSIFPSGPPSPLFLSEEVNNILQEFSSEPFLSVGVYILLVDLPSPGGEVSSAELFALRVFEDLGWKYDESDRINKNPPQISVEGITPTKKKKKLVRKRNFTP